MVNKRIDYIDTLKCIAIFAVIAIHGLSLLGQVKLFGYKVGSFQQIFRFAVPLFLMITGALFLDKEIVLKDYLKNRFVRVLYPLLFFTLLLYITKTSDHILYYYWYSWMIVGVLLAVPVINKFIQYSDETEIKYYLAVFVLFSIFCQVCHIFNIKYALDISFFYTPVSFLVLGYYLFNKKINISPYKIIILSVVLFIISTIIKIKTGNIHFTNDFHSYLDLSVFQIIEQEDEVLLKRVKEKREILGELYARSYSINNMVYVASSDDLNDFIYRIMFNNISLDDHEDKNRQAEFQHRPDHQIVIRVYFSASISQSE